MKSCLRQCLSSLSKYVECIICRQQTHFRPLTYTIRVRSACCSHFIIVSSQDASSTGCLLASLGSPGVCRGGTRMWTHSSRTSKLALLYPATLAREIPISLAIDIMTSTLYIYSYLVSNLACVLGRLQFHNQHANKERRKRNRATTHSDRASVLWRRFQTVSNVHCKERGRVPWGHVLHAMGCAI